MPTMGKGCSAPGRPFAGEVGVDRDESGTDRRLVGLGGVGFFMDRANGGRVAIGTRFDSIIVQRPRSVETPSGDRKWGVRGRSYNPFFAKVGEVNFVAVRRWYSVCPISACRLG